MRCDPIEKAVRWCKTTEKGQMFSNWERLDSRVWRAYTDKSKKTIMRNQCQLGFDNTLWPVLSRLLIMHYPRYRRKIHPRKSGVDNPLEIMRMVEAYRDITGDDPIIEDWRESECTSDLR